MLEIFGELRELNTASFFLRIFLAILFGGFIGITRGKKNKAAGFRTYMLVCLGSALAVLINQYLMLMLSTRWLSYTKSLNLTLDVARMGAQVINGIGFLGIGIVFVKGHENVEGLTTAAGLWASACMGIAIGAGFYEGVIISFLLILIAITLFSKLEDFLIEYAHKIIIYVEFYDFSTLKDIIRTIKNHHIEIYDLNIEPGDIKRGVNSKVTIYMNLKNKDIKHSEVLSAISDLTGVHQINEL